MRQNEKVTYVINHLQFSSERFIQAYMGQNIMAKNNYAV